MRNIFGAMFLSAALLTPTLLHAEERHEVRRYYDRDARDWHQWNEGEGQAYRRYLAERRRTYREFERTNRRDQRDYWKWRHTHPDNDRR